MSVQRFVVAFCIWIFMVTSCKEEDIATYSITINNPYDFDVVVMGGGRWETVEVGKNAEETFQQPVNEDGSGIWAYEKTEDGMYESGNNIGSASVVENQEPGKEYKWTVGDRDVTEMAGCGDAYDGPEFDVQVDSQCKAAYAYQCAGDETGRKAACQLYYDWKDSWTGSGSFPECPYCD